MNLRTLKWLVAGLSLGLVPVVAGCSSQRSAENPGDAPQSPAVAIVAGQTPDEAAKEKMLAAKEALFKRLSGRLVEAMSGQGPAAAITVCQQEAPAIANAVSEEHGLKIGRTGVRLRNPNNVAPAWAEPMVQDKTDTPRFVTLDNGRSAALLPIKLQGQCLMCHGPKQGIPPIIQEQLTKLYPNDQAIGFQEGELRGWFWIELPNG